MIPRFLVCADRRRDGANEKENPSRWKGNQECGITEVKSEGFKNLWTTNIY